MPEASEIPQPSPHLRQIGVPITDRVFEMMRELEQAGIGKVRPGSIGPLFVTCAAHEAISRYNSQYQVGHKELGMEWEGRGLVYCDMTGPGTKAWYVPRPDCKGVIPRATEETRAKVVSLVETYRPSREAVIVMLKVDVVELFVIEMDPATTTSTARPRSIVTDEQIREEGKFALLPMPKAPPPLVLPPGVISEREELPGGGVAYYFSHEDIGPLGRYMSLNAGAGQVELRAEIVGLDDDTPFVVDMRRELFGYIVEALNAKMGAVFPDAGPVGGPAAPGPARPPNGLGFVPKRELAADLYGLMAAGPARPRPRVRQSSSGSGKVASSPKKGKAKPKAKPARKTSKKQSHSKGEDWW